MFKNKTIISKNESEIKPMIDSFEVFRPDFVISGKYLWKVEIWAVEANFSEKGEQLRKIGEADLVSQDEAKQVWKLSIPKYIFSVGAIYARGSGWQKNETITYHLPCVGRVRLHNLLWQDAKAQFIDLGVGDLAMIGNLRLRLLRIVDDRRCPLDSEKCEEHILWAEFELSSGETKEVTILSTGSLDYFFDGFELKIIGAGPPLRLGQKIRISDYRLSMYILRMSLLT